MAGQSQPRVVRFGVFEANLSTGELRKHGLRVRVPGQPFKVLALLLERAGDIVTRDELRKNLWCETFVDFDHSLNSAMKKLREVLGDSAETPRYIETMPRLGYRFIAPVSSGGPDATVEPAPQAVSPISIFAVAAAVAIALLAGWLAWNRFGPRRPQVQDRVMLAVLPFQNLSGDPEQEFFADGLTEEMITQLGRLQPEQLGVIARTSVMPYKHTEKGLDQIGRELSVQYVLEGSFRRSADRMRITAQLIQVKDQSHLWAEEYDRGPADVVALQGEVAAAVVQQIRLRISQRQQAALTRTRPTDPAAYEELLRGRYFLNQRSAEGLQKAIGHFQLAIAKDPGYAQAYAGQASAYGQLGYYGLAAPNDVLPKARDAATKALAMDGRVADAYAALGLVAEIYDRDWRASEGIYKQAIRLNPNDSAIRNSYASTYLAPVGRFGEALAQLGVAHQLDPLSPLITSALGTALALTDRWDEGMEQFRKTFEIAPDFVPGHYFLAQAYTWKKSYSEALAEVEKISPPDSVPAIGLRGYVYALQGRRPEALQVIDKLRMTSETSYVDPVLIANVYVRLGDPIRAFVWLERGYEQHSEGMITLKESPAYDTIRSDPRFVDLERRVGFP